VDKKSPGGEATKSCYPVLSSDDQPAQRQLAKFFDGSIEGCNLSSPEAGRQVRGLQGVLGSEG